MNLKPTATIIGSSSGIGRALAEAHKRRGLDCILFSSRPDQIEGFNAFHLDLTDEEAAHFTFNHAFSQYADIENIYIVSGRGDVETEPSFASAKSTIALNCTGFTLAAYRAADYLEKKGHGRLVALTSEQPYEAVGFLLPTTPQKHTSRPYWKAFDADSPIRDLPSP